MNGRANGQVLRYGLLVVLDHSGTSQEGAEEEKSIKRLIILINRMWMMRHSREYRMDHRHGKFLLMISVGKDYCSPFVT